MNKKRIEKIQHERELKLKYMDQSKFLEPEISDVAIGILLVE